MCEREVTALDEGSLDCLFEGSRAIALFVQLVKRDEALEDVVFFSSELAGRGA